MVGADVGFAVTAQLLTNPRAAVAADIVHGPDIAGLGPRDNDRVFTDFDKLVVTGGGNLARMQRINPALENEVLEFLLVHQMGAIEVGIHGVMRTQLFSLQLVSHALKGIIYRSRDGVHGVSRSNRSINGVVRASATAWVI